MNVSECRKGIIMMKLRNVGKMWKEIQGQSILELKTQSIRIKGEPFTLWRVSKLFQSVRGKSSVTNLTFHRVTTGARNPS